MPIDASIPLSVRPYQAPDPMNALARAMQIKGLQQDQQVGQMKMDEYRRGVEETQGFNRLYQSALKEDGTIDRNLLLTGAARGGYGSKIPALQKSFDEQDKSKLELKKTGIETEKAQIETNLKKIGLGAQILSTAKDQASYDQARAVAQANGLDVSRMPPQFDPAFVQAKLNESLTMKDQLEQKWKAMEYITPNANSRLQADTSTANNQRSVAASYANANATREAASTNAQATRDAAAMRRDQDTEMKLSDDYRTQSKGFKEVSDAYRIITTSLDHATTSAAATMAGATKFMKLLDPGSVVRESELGMALAASGVLDRAANHYNTLKNGKTLNPKQAEDFRFIAGQIYKAAQDGQKQVDGNYTRQAKQYGLRPDMIVQDLGQNTSVPVDLGSMPAGKPTAPKVVDFGSLR